MKEKNQKLGLKIFSDLIKIPQIFINIFGFNKNPTNIYKYFNLINKNEIQILNQIDSIIHN
jgi:hypothetical protein